MFVKFVKNLAVKFCARAPDFRVAESFGEVAVDFVANGAKCCAFLQYHRLVEVGFFPYFFKINPDKVELVKDELFKFFKLIVLFCGHEKVRIECFFDGVDLFWCC